MIKSLSFNDLLSLIVDFQIDEYEEYLNSKKKNNKNEVEYADERQVTNLLCGSIPKQGGGVSHGG